MLFRSRTRVSICVAYYVFLGVPLAGILSEIEFLLVDDPLLVTSSLLTDNYKLRAKLKNLRCDFMSEKPTCLILWTAAFTYSRSYQYT